ncbi:MAG: Uncharacterised protein [Cryomorphaceae bacterium]|nr:MAG: Uncharacterised protein [Cryomorphaceae bacterium]
MPHEAEVVARVAAESNGVVVAVVLEKAEFAEVGGGGVELHANAQGPVRTQPGEGGALPEQRARKGGIGAKAVRGEIHESGVARPVRVWSKEGVVERTELATGGVKNEANKKGECRTQQGSFHKAD